jgi:hypothetical protein
VIAVLKTAVDSNDKWIMKNKDMVTVAIAVAERRIFVLSGQLFEEMKVSSDFKVNELDTVSDTMYDWFKAGVGSPDFSRTIWYRPLVK